MATAVTYYLDESTPFDDTAAAQVAVGPAGLADLDAFVQGARAAHAAAASGCLGVEPPPE